MACNRRTLAWACLSLVLMACGGDDGSGEQGQPPATARFEGKLVDAAGAASVMWVNTLCEATGGSEPSAECPQDAPSGASPLQSDGGFSLELRKGFDYRLLVMTSSGTVHGMIAICGQNVLEVPPEASASFAFGDCVESGSSAVPQYVPHNVPGRMNCGGGS